MKHQPCLQRLSSLSFLKREKKTEAKLSDWQDELPVMDLQTALIYRWLHLNMVGIIQSLKSVLEEILQDKVSGRRMRMVNIPEYAYD